MSTLTITEFLEARIAEDEHELDREFPKWAKDDFSYGGTDDYHQFTIGYGRALAECAAKRAIIAAFDPAAPDLDPYVGKDVIAMLAAVYADHPEYRKEWAL